MALVNSENILSLLFSYNPWWQTGAIQKEFNKPMKRFAYYEAMKTLNHEIRRSVILCGARRTGKTTIMYQAIHELLERGVLAKNILFISFISSVCPSAHISLVTAASVVISLPGIAPHSNNFLPTSYNVKSLVSYKH